MSTTEVPPMDPPDTTVAPVTTISAVKSSAGSRPTLESSMVTVTRSPGSTSPSPEPAQVSIRGQAVTVTFATGGQPTQLGPGGTTSTSQCSVSSRYGIVTPSSLRLTT